MIYIRKSCRIKIIKNKNGGDEVRERIKVIRHSDEMSVSLCTNFQAKYVILEKYYKL